jgi:hypothetical protein
MRRPMSQSEPEAKSKPDSKSRNIVAYARDLFLIFAPLGGLLYFLAYPDAFDAFLNWGIGLFH